MATVYRRTKRHPVPEGAEIKRTVISKPITARFRKGVVKWKDGRGMAREGMLADDGEGVESKNVLARPKRKPPRKARGRLSKKKKSRYDLDLAKDRLGLAPDVLFQEVNSVTMNRCDVPPELESMSPTKPELKQRLKHLDNQNTKHKLTILKINKKLKQLDDQLKSVRSNTTSKKKSMTLSSYESILPAIQLQMESKMCSLQIGGVHSIKILEMHKNHPEHLKRIHK